jgi:hypothetical protein
VIGRRNRREEHSRSRLGSIASRIRVVYSEIFFFRKIFNFWGRDFSPFPEKRWLRYKKKKARRLFEI